MMFLQKGGIPGLAGACRKGTSERTCGAFQTDSPGMPPFCLCPLWAQEERLPIMASTAKRSHRKARPSAPALPPLLVAIYDATGVFIKTVELPDPRMAYCRYFNDLASPTEGGQGQH